jgi:hypothetical protein
MPVPHGVLLLHYTKRLIYDRRWRSSRDELARMPRSGSDCAAAAQIGGRKPNAASDKPNRLYTAVKAILVLTTRIVRRAMRSDSGTSVQSSRSRATWVASNATSLPATPIADSMSGHKVLVAASTPASSPSFEHIAAHQQQRQTVEQPNAPTPGGHWLYGRLHGNLTSVVDTPRRLSRVGAPH